MPLTMEPDSELPEDAHTSLKRILAYWREKRIDGRLPARKDVNPVEIAPLLSLVALLDVIDGDCRFRLVGEELNDHYGGALKGRTLRELLAGEALAKTLEEHGLCARAKRPVYTLNTFASASHNDIKRYQRLILPLADDGETVDTILTIMHFMRR